MAKEPILIIIKPDAIVKGLTGTILAKLAEADLKIIGAKVVAVPKELAEEHYQHLSDKPFFDEVIRYIMGEYHTKRVIALVYYGEESIHKVRTIAGATNPTDAEPTSLRGMYGCVTDDGLIENVIHASSALDEAEREIKLWFQPDEIAMDLFPFTEKEVTETRNVWSS